MTQVFVYGKSYMISPYSDHTLALSLHTRIDVPSITSPTDNEAHTNDSTNVRQIVIIIVRLS